MSKLMGRTPANGLGVLAEGGTAAGVDGSPAKIGGRRGEARLAARRRHGQAAQVRMSA